MVDTAEEINRLKVILMNPNTFTIAAAEAVERAATAANAAITYTEEMTLPGYVKLSTGQDQF